MPAEMANSGPAGGQAPTPSRISAAATDSSTLEAPAPLLRRRQSVIALFALIAIALSCIVRFALPISGTVFGLPIYELPLLAALILGGGPLVLDLLAKLWRGEF